MLTMENEEVTLAGCLVEKDGRFLLVQEAQKKAYKLWNTPAGHVDEGETVEQAAVRETKEESGYDVVLGRKLGVYQSKRGHPLHIFSAQIIGGELSFPADEILDARWLTKDEIKQLDTEGKLRGPHILLALDEYLNN